MPLPAVLAGIGSFLSNPSVLATIGTIMPSVISALTGSPTEDEAKAKVAPQREAMLAELVKQGLDPVEAERLADESVVKQAMDGGGIPGWLEGALMVGSGLGGFKVGKWLKSRKGATPDAATPAAATPAAATPAPSAASVVDESGPTLTGPFVKPVRDPGARMSGGTQTNMATLGPEDMPTAEIQTPFAPPRRPIDPLTGAPRPPRGRIDPTTGAPMPTEEVRPVAEIDGPFFKRDPLTGGKAYSTGEQRAFEAENRYAEPAGDAASRRAALAEVDALEAAAKQRQIEAMRDRDDRARMGPRIRGGLTEGLQTQAGYTGE